MAINGLTYYVSVDNPNFKILDENNVATTSATTSGLSIRKATESVYYSHLPEISRGSYNVDTQLIFTNTLTISSYSSTDNYIQAEASNITVGVSVPADYTDTGTSIIRTDWHMNVSLTPSFKMTWDSALKSYVAESKSSEYSYTSSTLSGDLVAFNINDGTSNVSVLRFMTISSESSDTGTSTLPDSFILYNSLATTTASNGYTFTSYSNNNTTAYRGSSYNNTWKHCTIWKTYSIDTNSFYSYKSTTEEEWSTLAGGILNRSVTTSTSWINGAYTQSTDTCSTRGVIADEEGNVAYGFMYGYGPYINLDYYSLRPAVITSFYKMADVSTVDTSWYGTFSSVTITSNETRTYEKYAEFNNYGMGGVLSQSTYYWNTSSGTGFSEYTRPNNIFCFYGNATAYVDITLTDAIKITTVISDNSYPRQSETKSTISRSEWYSDGSFSRADSVTSSITLSEEIASTRTNFSTLYSVDFTAAASNYALSTTKDYTTSATGLDTSYATTFYEITETSSCNVTSYSNDNGYSYYTTFYGELANETFYATSWVNSAVASSSTESYVNILTAYTVGYTNKTFGDVVNSTTIHDERVISSKVYRTSSLARVVSELFIESSTFKSVDIPLEYFTTQYTSWNNSTRYYTYNGPKIGGEYDWDSYYDFNVTVTENGSYSNKDYIGSQESTSSAINTTAYGGTTYRLSELVSSSSGVIIGSSNMIESYAYDYDVKSMFSLNDFITTLSNYTTRLETTYTSSYSTDRNYDDYHVTRSTSLAARSTGERFIDRVEISRTFTSNYYVTYTVAMYNYSTIGTVSSSASLGYTQSDQNVSTAARTFISSTADLATASEIASSTTATAANGSFIYSSRELVSYMTEQQNDTLIFASTFNTYSFYNSSYTTSTFNTVESTLSATTYEEWYDSISWTSTALSVATTTSVDQTVNTTSGVVSVTQSVNYTPTYNDVDGIYITTN